MPLCNEAEGEGAVRTGSCFPRAPGGRAGMRAPLRERRDSGLTRWGEGRRWLFTTGAGMLPGDGWRWESLVASCSHARPRSSLPPSLHPGSLKTPVNCHSLPAQRGNWPSGSQSVFLFTWLMSRSRRGCKGEAGGNFGTVCFPSEDRGVC